MDASDTGKRSYVASTDFASLSPSLCLVAGWHAWACGPVAKSAGRSHQHKTSSRSPSRGRYLQTFKAQVNVVNLFFNVKDKHGMLIPNLTKD